MLGTIERQTLSAVMVHHLRDAGKHTAALVQGVAVFFSLSDDDVNAALARPRRTEEQQRNQTVSGFLSAPYAGLTVKINTDSLLVNTTM